MSKKDDALKLAQEALEYISSHYMSLPKIGCMALAAVEEALAEQPAQQQEPDSDEYGEALLSAWDSARDPGPAGDDVPHPVFTAGFKAGWDAKLAEQPAQHRHISYVCPQCYWSLEEQPAQPKGCQCPACKVTPHASDCAVHNEPAYPNGACNCRAQPEQEPVAHVYLFDPNGRPRVAWDNAKDIKIGDKLYTATPQRKPLTHPQIHEFDWPDGVSFEDILLFVRAIEAAHGIKENT